ncbi:hypothetical protein [Phyllobacterium sp. SB3]|uniref:DUF6925 family protein n=1 Tax=Phyllobacterium sp. SB3 TaxID=3156073 RepID=UPI0032AF890A
MDNLRAVLTKHLGVWQSSWSMGTFGAIAEFHQDKGEQPIISDVRSMTRATRRGAVELDPKMVGNIVPVAYEVPSPRAHRWTQAVALCLPERQARRAARPVLTELGPDDNAIRGIDRMGILFDMGLSLPQCDFCIRTTDPKLLAELRANAGRSLFEPDNPVMHTIFQTHPHRVALTNIGRVEVYQKIGGPDTGGVSPAGPHTHVLPKLLKTGRTHSANTPIPDHLMPCGFLHPGNPVIGPLGEDTKFDWALHAQFERMFFSYGPEEAVAVKKRLIAALNEELPCENFEKPSSRAERAALRVGLRQQLAFASVQSDHERVERIKSWQTIFDRESTAIETDDDTPGH